MTLRKSRFRWMLWASVPPLVGGMVLVYRFDTGPWRTAGLVAFVVGACVYVTARIGGIIEDRNR